MSDRHRSTNDGSRRRFLGGLAAAAGIGIFGSLGRRWFGGSEAQIGAAPSTTTTARAPSTAAAPSTSAAPQASTTTPTPTTAAPTTTEAPPTTAASTTTTEPAPTTTVAPTTTAATTTTTAIAAGGSTVILIEKAGWGAAAEGSGFSEHQISRIMVHHTAVVLGANSNAPSRFRGHQAFHQDQGWPDLAYHVMVDRVGNLYEARPMWARGDTFTEYDPSGFFLACLEGDYNSESPTDPQLESLARLCAWAAKRWGVDPATIVGHRDEASTTCPGANLYSHISSGDLSARVSTLMPSIGELAYLRGEPAASFVAAVEAGG